MMPQQLLQLADLGHQFGAHAFDAFRLGFNRGLFGVGDLLHRLPLGIEVRHGR